MLKLTKREVKHHRQVQEEDEKGKVGPRELRSKVPVDGDAKEGQVWHKQRAEVLLLHRHDPNGMCCMVAHHVLPLKYVAAGYRRLMRTHVHSATRQHRHIRA
jgi:hypothetical protein